MTRNLAKRGRPRLPRVWIASAITLLGIGAAASTAVAGHVTAPARNGPPGPVGELAIFSTTSIPFTTAPNTV